jgi:hypothetical protein
MISDDRWGPMIAHDGCRAMVADHGTAATIVAVASRRSFVCCNKGQTGGEHDGDSGQCSNTSIHDRVPLLQVMSLRHAPLGICERDHKH